MNTIKTFYNIDGADYGYRRWQRNPVSKFDYQFTYKAITDFLHKSKYNKSLEIGCGPGTWTVVLNDYSNQITAVEISEKMVEIVSSKKELANCEFVNSDIDNFQFDYQYDLVFSIRAFEYFKNKKEFIDKCASGISDGGRLFIITKTRGSYWYGKSKIRNLLRKILPILFYYEDKELNHEIKNNTSNFWQERLLVKDFKQMLRDAGFKDIVVKPVIIRPPIFMRGKSEIPLIPPLLEKPVLYLFKPINYIFSGFAPFTIFAESYSISATK